MESTCNYPEASLTGTVHFENHTVYGREIMVPRLNGYLSYTGPKNYTVKNLHLSAKQVVEYNRSNLRLRGLSFCNPNDN